VPGAVGRGALLPRHLHLHRQGGRDWRVCAGRRVACERTLARMTSAVSALAAMNAALVVRIARRIRPVSRGPAPPPSGRRVPPRSGASPLKSAAFTLMASRMLGGHVDPLAGGAPVAPAPRCPRSSAGRPWGSPRGISNCCAWQPAMGGR